MQPLKSNKQMLLGCAAFVLLAVVAYFVAEEQKRREDKAFIELSRLQKEYVFRENFKHLDPLPPSVKNLELPAIDSTNLSGITQEQRIRDAVRAEFLANMPPPPMPETKVEYGSSQTSNAYIESPSIISKMYETGPSTPARTETTITPPIQNQMTTYMYQGRAVQCTNYSNASAQYCY